MGVAYACAKPLWRRGRAVFAAIVVLLLAACETELYTGLSEREANEIVAVLMNAGIPAEKTFDRDDTLSVVVDQDRFAEAVSILNARGLPRQTFDSIGDIFEKEGLISSPTEERARFIYALSQELSRTVAEIDGVLSARIHVVLPENDAFRRDVRPSSASVFVRHDGAVPLDGPIGPDATGVQARTLTNLAGHTLSFLAGDLAISEFSVVAKRLPRLLR